MKLININSQNKTPYRFNAKTPNLCIEPNSKIGLMSAALIKKEAITIDDNNNLFLVQMGGRGTDVVADNSDTQDPLQIMHLGQWYCQLKNGTYDVLGLGTSANSESQKPSPSSLFGHMAQQMHDQCPFRMWGWYAEYIDTVQDSTVANIYPFIKDIDTSNVGDASISSRLAINSKTVSAPGNDINFVNETGSQLMTFTPDFDENDPLTIDDDNFAFVYKSQCPYPFESEDTSTTTALGHPICEMILPSIAGRDYFAGAGIGLATAEMLEGNDDDGGEEYWFDYSEQGTGMAEDFYLFEYRGPIGVRVQPDGKIFFESRLIDENGFCRQTAPDESEEFTQEYEDNKRIGIEIYSNFSSQPTDLIFTCIVKNLTDGTQEQKIIDLGESTGLRQEDVLKNFQFFVVGGAKLKKNDGDPLDAPIAVFGMTENRLKQNYADRRGSLNLLGSSPDYNTTNIGRMNAYLIPNPIAYETLLYSHASGDDDNYLKVEADMAALTERCNADFLTPGDGELSQSSGDWDPNYWLWHGENAFISISPFSKLKIKNNYCFHIKNLPIESISANPEGGRTDRIIHTHYEDENNNKSIVIQPHNIHMIQLKNTNKFVLSNLDVEIRTPDGVLCESLIGTSYLTLVIDTDKMLNKMDKLINAMRMNTYSKESQNYAEQYDKINNSVKA